MEQAGDDPVHRPRTSSTNTTAWRVRRWTRSTSTASHRSARTIATVVTNPSAARDVGDAAAADRRRTMTARHRSTASMDARGRTGEEAEREPTRTTTASTVNHRVQRASRTQGGRLTGRAAPHRSRPGREGRDAHGSALDGVVVVAAVSMRRSKSPARRRHSEGSLAPGGTGPSTRLRCGPACMRDPPAMRAPDARPQNVPAGHGPAGTWETDRVGFVRRSSRGTSRPPIR